MTLILNFTFNHTVTNSTNTRTTSSFCKEFAEVIDGLEAEYLIASVMESSSIFSCALNSLRNFTSLGERNGFIELHVQYIMDAAKVIITVSPVACSVVQLRSSCDPHVTVHMFTSVLWRCDVIWCYSRTPRWRLSTSCAVTGTSKLWWWRNETTRNHSLTLLYSGRRWSSCEITPK